MDQWKDRLDIWVGRVGQVPEGPAELVEDRIQERCIDVGAQDGGRVLAYKPLCVVEDPEGLVFEWVFGQKEVKVLPVGFPRVQEPHQQPEVGGVGLRLCVRFAKGGPGPEPVRVAGYHQGRTVEGAAPEVGGQSVLGFRHRCRGAAEGKGKVVVADTHPQARARFEQVVVQDRVAVDQDTEAHKVPRGEVGGDVLGMTHGAIEDVAGFGDRLGGMGARDTGVFLDDVVPKLELHAVGRPEVGDFGIDPDHSVVGAGKGGLQAEHGTEDDQDGKCQDLSWIWLGHIISSI